MHPKSISGGSLKLLCVSVCMLQVRFDEVLVSRVWAASLAMAPREFPIQKLAGDSSFIHADDLSCPAQLGFHDHCFNASSISPPDDLEVQHLVRPAYLHDGAEAAQAECL